MKLLNSMFLSVVALLWGAAFKSEAQISTELIISPIDEASATVHEFSIIYSSSSGIDVGSLGNDDVLLGKGSLFEPQLGNEAFYAELVATDTEGDSQKVMATYRVHRPENGWESYGLRRLSVYVESGAVLEKTGNFFPGDGLGNLEIDLDTVPVMTIQLQQAPIVSSDDPSIQFQVVYRANMPLDLDQFDQGEILVFKRFGPIDENGNVTIDVDIPFEGFEASLESIEANPDRTVVKADYRLDRPETGWGDIDLFIRLITEKLGTNDYTHFPGSGNKTLGYGRIVQENAVTAVLKSREPVLITAESFVIDVTYESGASKVDITTLGDDDFGKWVTFFDFLQISVDLQEIVATEKDGRKVTARYELSPPEGETWSAFARGTVSGSNDHVTLYSNSGSVLAEDGSPLRAGAMGDVYFEVPEGVVLPQLVALDDWYQELEKTIGNGKVTSESDYDRDGLADVVEFMLGADPLDGSNVAAINVRVDEERLLLLTFKNRTNVLDAELLLEGSSTGESWDSMADSFEIVNHVSLDGSELMEVTARSVKDITAFPYRLFRVKVIFGKDRE